MHAPAIVTQPHESESDYHDIDLNILEQAPCPIYTQICLCFPVADDFSESHQAIISTLTAGLERLSASFPWIAGQVVNEGASEGNSGVFKIRRLDAESTHRLVVKDLRHVTHDSSISTMDALRRASFPMGMLTESIVAPRTTLPSDSDPDSGVTPVFLVQATFIPGGLLLTFLGHHNAMDVMGQGQVIRLLSKACRGEQFTSEELASGNLPRHDLIPLLDDYTPGPELAHQIVDRTPSASDAPPPPPPPKCTWGYFSFPATALADLKSLATDATTLPAAGYISTDDALTALIWQSATRARLPRLQSSPPPPPPRQHPPSPAQSTPGAISASRRHI